MSYSPKDISRLAKGISADLGFKDRFLMTYRPMICPFHVLMKHVEPGSKFLDIGCGNGLWLLLLSRLGMLGSGVGVEIAQRSIDIANSLKRDSDPIDFRCIPAEQSWPEGDFNTISMIDVLHHVPHEYQKAFIDRIDATGAKKVIFKDIDPVSCVKASMNSIHDIVLSHQKPVYAKPSDVKSWLEGLGFTITEHCRCDMLWYSHYLIVAQRD